MKLEDLVIRLKIEEYNRNAEKKSRKSSTIIEVNIVEEAPTKDKKRKKSNGQKLKKLRRNSKAIFTTVVRLVIDLLIVML